MAAIKASLEHVNVTVRDPQKTAKMLAELFGWRVRWEGPSLLGGYTVHVGNDHDYLAIYAPQQEPGKNEGPKSRLGNLNHIGVAVDDLDATEIRVKALGFTPFNHGSYEPGRRFYFLDDDNVEYELVSYA